MRRWMTIFILIWPLAAGGLSWLHSYDQAVKLAKQEGKNIMVFVEAEHCPFCEEMRREVLSDPDVVKALEHSFVPVRLEINDRAIRQHFPHTSVTPTTYFVTPRGEILMDIVGRINAEFFYWRLDAAEREAARIRKAMKR